MSDEENPMKRNVSFRAACFKYARGILVSVCGSCNRKHPPPTETTNTLDIRGLYYPGWGGRGAAGWVGWLVRVWSPTCSSQDEENEPTVN